jgi:hypothetical protein
MANKQFQESFEFYYHEFDFIVELWMRFHGDPEHGCPYID